MSTGFTSPAWLRGSVAFAAVQKITNAKWSGMIIRFAEAAVAFLPVSLIGLVLIFTVGIRLDLRPNAERPARDAALEGGVALPRFHVRPAGAGPARAHHRRLEAGLGRHEARHVCRAALGGRRSGGSAIERWAQGYDAASATIAAHDARIYRLAPAYTRAVCLRADPGRLRRDHGAPAALVLQPAGRLDLHGRVSGRSHAPGAADDLRRQAPGRRRPGVTQAAARPGQALFRVHAYSGPT